MTAQSLAALPTVIDSLAAAARDAGGRLLAAPRPPLPANMAEFRRTFGEIDDAVAGGLGERLAAIRRRSFIRTVWRFCHQSDGNTKHLIDLGYFMVKFRAFAPG